MARGPSQAVPATHVALSPDGQYLAMAGAGDAVLIRDMSADDVRALPGHGASATAESGPDGAHPVTGADDGRLLIWPMSALDGHAAEVAALAFTSDGSALVTASSDGTARLRPRCDRRWIG